MIKAHQELSRDTKEVVFLVPARTDTAWFHDLVLARGGADRVFAGSASIWWLKELSPISEHLDNPRNPHKISPISPVHNPLASLPRSW